MQTDTDVILLALSKEREELHQRLMQIDRIISRVKSLEYTHDVPLEPVKELPDNKQADQPLNLFPRKADIRVQVVGA